MNKGNLDKDDAKKLISNITNGGDIKNSLDCLLLYKYKDEITYIHDYICNQKENEEYLKIEPQMLKRKTDIILKALLLIFY